ncbi:sugar (Glycoside-Pentoside-Hexuronide) transporter [Paludibacter propionicigenes WB4]|uniref:Sugar (Glycoside-Pentoside-Hexuronide) transporter n=1 Tax=Paludibacter propionicigenes (strain DSM 17365 / JCM 13257 / WB4) TaxID=694427 RepID=E4T5F9_PALPW|nr:MFS transporter [Paludibacter propionicigenes]ADQ79953.1 sugar (Glycoside-Pentoside-Hexuronide) transporter [Paludibacter propionicigenes WB4]
MDIKKLSLKEKIGYGFGDAASSMFWKLFGMYIMFFYTDIYGIPAAIVGTMFLITRVGDAIIDPFIGIMADRTETRWGKFRPYLLWMAIPFGIIGVLTFTTPNMGMTGKIIYAYATYSLMMIIYSMINVPYASLMGVMTSDGKERTTLATFRFIFAFGGSFLVLALFQPLFDGFGTKTVSNYSEPKLVQLTDSTQASAANLYVWNGQITSELKDKPVDSLLFVSAKIITKSKDAFKIGVLNTTTNQYSWVNFAAGKDTLGLLRDGSTSNVLIRLSSIVPKETLNNLGILKVVYSSEKDSDVKFTKVAIKQIDYKTGFQYAVMVIAIMAVIFFLLTFSWTRERVKPISEKTKLKDDLKDLTRNMPWFILLGASVSTIFFNTIRDGAAVYYFLYYFKGESSIEITSTTALAISTVYLLLGQAANIVGVVLAKPVSDRIGKKNTFLVAMLFATILSVIFYFVDKSNLYAILGFQFLISINAGIIFPLVWSMYADTADYSEWKNKRRATGLVFSAASMSQKFGASLGIAAVGWIMAMYHYIPNVEQAISTQNGFRMMLSLFPAIGALLAAVFMFIYPLNEKKMKEIATDLAVERDKK